MSLPLPAAGDEAVTEEAAGGEPRCVLAPMCESDIEEVLRIEYDVYSHPWSRGNFSDSLAAGYHGRVLRVGGELLGYAVIMPVVDEAHLLNISVAARAQGRGYGAQLLADALAVARTLGATTLLLEVRPSNLRALALYQGFGFRQIGFRRGYYPAAGGREDALVLTRSVEEPPA